MANMVRTIQDICMSNQQSTVTHEYLAQQWGIGPVAAERTLNTTQAGIRNVLSPLEWKTCIQTNHLKHPALWGQSYMDTMFSKVRSMQSTPRYGDNITWTRCSARYDPCKMQPAHRSTPMAPDMSLQPMAERCQIPREGSKG